jgi:hypothetical protein
MLELLYPSTVQRSLDDDSCLWLLGFHWRYAGSVSKTDSLVVVAAPPTVSEAATRAQSYAPICAVGVVRAGVEHLDHIVAQEAAYLASMVLDGFESWV